MSTLSLKPEAAAARAARRAAKAALGMPAPSAAPPTPPTTSRGASPATQVKVKAADATSNKHERKRQQLDALEQKLSRMWSHLFGDRANPVPLAIGIRWQIASHLDEQEQKLLPAVLGRWCGRGKYRHALTQPGACRCDLQGNLVPVSQEDAEHAAQGRSKP